MEFNFNINHLLGETITKLDCNFSPARRNADGHDHHALRSQLITVIDKMGELSAQAQGLYTVITTGRKLQYSDHILYMMKDASGNNGRGTVVGLLKIGHKKLFVYNRHGSVHEMEPLCVLDFYVHESRQRMGCGRRLFDFMLQDQGVKAPHLAIDKPSFKFSQFLKKHYNLRAELPQVNNFVVFEGFFSDRPDHSVKRTSSLRKPPVHPSKLRDYGGEEGVRRQNTYGGYGFPPLPAPGSAASRPNSGTNGIHSRSSSVTSNHQKDLPTTTEYQRNGQLRPISANEEQTEPRVVSAQAAKTQGQQMYSRHISDSPSGARPGSRPSSHTRLPGPSHNTNQTTTYQDPPMLQRGGADRRGMADRGQGADKGYLDNFNLHREYQSRGGHMKVSSAVHNHVRNPLLAPEEDIRSYTGWPPQREATNWTVFNKPPGYLSIAQRNYTHTRLW